MGGKSSIAYRRKGEPGDQGLLFYSHVTDVIHHTVSMETDQLAVTHPQKSSNTLSCGGAMESCTTVTVMQSNVIVFSRVLYDGSTL